MVTGGGTGIKGDVAVLWLSSGAASLTKGKLWAVDGGLLQSEAFLKGVRGQHG
jgi:hypothetical protein